MRNGKTISTKCEHTNTIHCCECADKSIENISYRSDSIWPAALGHNEHNVRVSLDPVNTYLIQMGFFRFDGIFALEKKNEKTSCVHVIKFAKRKKRRHEIGSLWIKNLNSPAGRWVIPSKWPSFLTITKQRISKNVSTTPCWNFFFSKRHGNWNISIDCHLYNIIRNRNEQWTWTLGTGHLLLILNLMCVNSFFFCSTENVIYYFYIEFHIVCAPHEVRACVRACGFVSSVPFVVKHKHPFRSFFASVFIFLCENHFFIHIIISPSCRRIVNRTGTGTRGETEANIKHKVHTAHTQDWQWQWKSKNEIKWNEIIKCVTLYADKKKGK